MSNDLIGHVKFEALKICKLIENQSPYLGGSVLERRQQRYPFERDLSNYKKKLMDLGPVLGNLPKASRILDIGMGKGYALSSIQDRFGYSVVGTNIQIPKECFCPFIASVASDLPFSDSSFDLILSVHGISWEPDQTRAIEEVVRVLKPGFPALIYLSTFSDCMALWYGDKFWDEIKIPFEKYKPYEFSVENYSKPSGFDLTIIAIDDISINYTDAYYLQIQKKDV